VTPRILARPNLAQIRSVAQQIADQFHPQTIILFGSYAYGHPTADSDVDLLVVLDRPSATLHDAGTISQAIDHPFPVDLVVQGTADWDEWLREGALFAREVSEKGLVLYEAGDSRVGRQS
jgi:predicted nucleotidyltransferase